MYGSVRGAPGNWRPYRDLCQRPLCSTTAVVPCGLAQTVASLDQTLSEMNHCSLMVLLAGKERLVEQARQLLPNGITK
jgi:hypothetical protein